VEPNWRRSTYKETDEGGFQGDVSSLFLAEGDKMTKTKRRFEEKK
jgi:hypothetical protein